jgi:peptidoglycan/LPS O-acetylase OafA/YrhL
LKKKDLPHSVYFPNLDGLRLIGSLIIIVFHIENAKILANRIANPIVEKYTLLGDYDVSLFFVLSGFLITWLLLSEKKKSGTINLKDYYTRRSLRIWPLYFLILIVGFFVMPHFDPYFQPDDKNYFYKHFWTAFIACALFLSPFLSKARTLPQSIGPMWSVRVEELFYLCWPLFLRRTKKYFLLLIGVVIFTLVLRNGLFIFYHLFGLNKSIGPVFLYLKKTVVSYRISCMAIGGIGAYLVAFEKKKILSFLYRKDFQWLIYISTIVLLIHKVGIIAYSREDFPDFSYEFYSILFAIIIVNLATNPNSIINLNYKWMSYLGKVSYGMYLYHPIMRMLSLRFTEYVFKQEIIGWQMNVMLYATTILSTILVAILSYEYLEKYFMRLRPKLVKLKK